MYQHLLVSFWSLINYMDNTGTSTILNVKIDNLKYNDFIENLAKGFVVTPNLDHLVMLQEDKEFYEVYQNADSIVCDSRILYFLSKFTREPIVETIPGSSFFTDYCDFHRSNEKIKIFLLGAAEGVAKTAMENINSRIGREIIVDCHSPSYGFEKNEKECLDIIEIIKQSEANVLLVGVGAPKQEKWIHKYRSLLPQIDLFLPLGATIDFEAGNVKRAPKIFQKTGMEWLYRIFQDPKRLLHRYLIKDTAFFMYFLKQLAGKYKDPFLN